VTDPTLLNKYQSFTSETYGETNFSQMDKIIQTLNWTEDDVFVDLGSGIGSLVMQVIIIGQKIARESAYSSNCPDFIT